MVKFQRVSFRHVDEFLDYLPEPERLIVEDLRHLIFETLPQIQEKLSYNVPYYSRYRRICFLWQPAVEWGGHRQSGVLLGFTHGFLMQDDLNFLDKGNRKQVYTHTFTTRSEVDPSVVVAYLLEAWHIDEKLENGRRFPGRR